MSNMRFKLIITILINIVIYSLCGCTNPHATNINDDTVIKYDSKEKANWIENKLIEDKENSELVPYNIVEVKIENTNLTFPFLGKQLTALGLVDDNVFDVPGHTETYGDMRKKENSEILLGYINLQDKTLSKEECSISNIQADNNLISLQIGNQEIAIGTKLIDILTILKEKEIDIMSADNKTSETFKDLTVPYENNKTSRVSVLNTDDSLGTFSLSIVTKNDTNITAYKDENLPKELVGKTFEIVGYTSYILSGTYENGVDLIIINYDAVDANELAYRYDYLQ